jgi:hypothetical protein
MKEDVNYLSKEELSAYSNSKSVSEWCTDCYEVSRSKGWYDVEKVGTFERLLLVHCEISEAVEELRAGHLVDQVYLKNGKPEGAIVEIADAIIRIFDLCGGEGLDLAAVINLKNEYNKTRPYRHGGKVI